MNFFIQNKTVFRELLTVLPAGCATTGPPLGPLLGQFGVNTPSFCKQFNEATSIFSSLIKNKIILLSVKIFIYDDKTLGFVITKPQTSFLLKQLRKKLAIPSRSLYIISLEDLFKVVFFKFGPIGNSSSLFKFSKIVLGTANSMKTILVK